MTKKRKTSSRQAKPYQISHDGSCWDYSIKIKGLIYEVSVDRFSGKLYINEDEFRG